jgi:hypothetical protein
MASKVLSGYVAASLLLVAGLTTSVEAQPYFGSGAGQTWTPYSGNYYGPAASGAYPYWDYGYSYVPLVDFFLNPPYASRYLHSYSYTPSPYRPVPGGAAYGTPPFSYSPDAYTYDLNAAYYADLYAQYYADLYGVQSYPYYPSYYYPSPVVPYGYYSRFLPRRWRSPYRPMPLPEYLHRQSQGPTRVRDIVPGIPELGG